MERTTRRKVRTQPLSLLFVLSFLGLFSAAARADFDEASWGARPWGFGGAYIGMQGDAYAPFWNPGASGRLSRSEAAFSFMKPAVRAGQPDQNLGAFSMVIGSTRSAGAWGLWGSHLTAVNVRAENTFGLNYGRSFYQDDQIDFSLGFNLKYLHQKLSSGVNQTRSDLGADVGFLFTLDDRLQIGASVRDLNRPRAGSGADERVSASAGAGASFWLTPDLVFALDASDIGGAGKQVRGGLERWFLNNHLALRAGANRDHGTGGLTLASRPWLGAVWSLEYAYGHPFRKDENDPFHIASLRASFGGPVDDGEGLPPAPDRAEGEPAAKAFQIPGMPPKSEATGKASFLLGPEDIVQIDVENHPELNITTPIDPWGFLKLPYVGQLDVKSMTPEKLGKTLEKIYANFFIEPPTVKVNVKEYNSRVVYVFGAVNAPGKYPLKGNPITLRDIILLAGLPTERAANWRVYIIRQTPEGPVYKHVNLGRILYRGHLEKNVELESGDIVYVPMGILDSIVTYLGRIVGPIFGYTRDFIGKSTF